MSNQQAISTNNDKTGEGQNGGVNNQQNMANETKCDVSASIKNNATADEDDNEAWEPPYDHNTSSSPIAPEEEVSILSKHHGNNDNIPFAYLAALSREVYGSCDEEGYSIIDTADLSSAGSQTDIISIGADRFSYNITSKTLFVSICGTFHPAQHIMNIMPHLATGVNVARQLLGNSSGTPKSFPHAYDDGFQKGWKDPASRIYNEILKRVGSKDLNRLFDAVYLTGHSRGGLLAYYVGWNFFTQSNYSGHLHVVGFGMPSPLKEPSAEESEFIKCNVTSVIHRNDPVANESYTKCSNNWYPTKIIVGKEKIKSVPVVANQDSPRTSGGGGSLWGLVGGVIKTAVSAVGDTINEIREDIETYHSIQEYEIEISNYATRDITSMQT